MTVRTLAEAAAEILTASKANSPAEPMKKLAGAEVVDLGGATHTDPAGGPVGAKASEKMTKATPPGKTPPVGAEAPKGIKEEEEPEDEELEELEEDVADEELTEEEIAEARKMKVAMLKDKMKKYGVKEDIDALFNGEDLSEEFKEKVTAIFEAAVINKAIPVIEEIESEILAAAEETLVSVKEELEEKVDSYMGYVVESWMEKNEVAIESGLRAEIHEDFMRGLHNLFVENYIDIPEDSVDIVEALSDEAEELRAKLNEALNENIELAKAINESRAKEIQNSVCEGLTATQAEKMKSLAESVEFTTEGEYREKLAVIKESYFSSKVNKASGRGIEAADAIPMESLNEGTKVIVPEMNAYVQAISKTIK